MGHNVMPSGYTGPRDIILPSQIAGYWCISCPIPLVGPYCAAAHGKPGRWNSKDDLHVTFMQCCVGIPIGCNVPGLTWERVSGTEWKHESGAEITMSDEGRRCAPGCFPCSYARGYHGYYSGCPCVAATHLWAPTDIQPPNVVTRGTVDNNEYLQPVVCNLPVLPELHPPVYTATPVGAPAQDGQPWNSKSTSLPPSPRPRNQRVNPSSQSERGNGSSATHMGSANFCESCGTAYSEDGANFCSHCGAKRAGSEAGAESTANTIGQLVASLAPSRCHVAR